MLTLSAQLTAALGQQTVKPVFIVELVFDGSTSFKARRGHSSNATVAGYPGSVAAFGPVPTTLDPLTRRAKVGQMTIEFLADGWMRQRIYDYRWRNRQVVITAGVEDSAESDFAPRFSGLIDQIKPHADGSVTLIVSDAFAVLRDKEIMGVWEAFHPLEAVQDILDRAEVPASLYDATSFDVSQSQYAAISHLCITRGAGHLDYSNDLAVREPTKAFDLIDQLLQLVDGAMFADEAGELKFVVFDPAATVRAVWTAADINHDDFETEELDGNAINRINVAWARDGDNKYLAVLVRDEQNSQADLVFPGESSRILSAKYSSDWIEGHAKLHTAMTAGAPGVGDTFVVRGIALFGMSGCNFPNFTSGSQAAHYKASSTRIVTLKIDDELITCDVCTVSLAANKMHLDYTDPQDGTHVNQTVPGEATFRVLARGAHGTTAATHEGTNAATGFGTDVYDATIPYHMADKRLDRWSYGVPIVRLRTSLKWYHLQIADFVQVQTDKFFCKGALNSNAITWEIIGKDVQWEGDGVGITWTLAYATQTSPPSTGKAGKAIGTRDVSVSLNAKNNMEGGFSFTAGATGQKVTAGSGLSVTVATGKTTSALGAIDHKTESTISNLEASSDTYVYRCARTGAFLTKAVSVGDPEPDPDPNLVRIAKVTTNGSVVTAVASSPRQQTFATGSISVQSHQAKTSTPRAANRNANFQAFSRG